MSSTSVNNDDHIPTALVVSEEGEVDDNAFNNYLLLNNEPNNNSSSSSATARSGDTASNTKSSLVCRARLLSNDSGITLSGNQLNGSSSQENTRGRRMAGSYSRIDEYNASGNYPHPVSPATSAGGSYQGDYISSSYQSRGMNVNSSSSTTSTTKSAAKISTST